MSINWFLSNNFRSLAFLLFLEETFRPKKPLNVAGAINRDILSECPRLSRFEVNGYPIHADGPADKGAKEWSGRCLSAKNDAFLDDLANDAFLDDLAHINF